MIQEALQKLVDKTDLTHQESQEVMKEIMSGKATSIQIAALLTALRMKGETISEITAFAKIMHQFCHQIYPRVNGRLVDTCGTGGDQIKTFNVSTTAAFVVSGAGIAVAKHGNRSVSSKCGSADVLEKLGLNLNLEPKAVGKTIEEVGIGFMFAPAFHPAMKYAMEARKAIGLRTVFNILGPLTNPANANAQLLGVYNPTLVEPLGYVLKNLGREEAMVVHGSDGLDEISTIGKTSIAWLRDGKVTVLETTPKDFGIKPATLEEIRGTTPDESAEITFKILYGCCNRDDPKKNMVLVNSAAGIIVGGNAEDFSHGIELARESIDSGAAYKKLKMLITASEGNASKLEELEQKYG
jgi:anthranilate phosphoribosyltransferase